MIGEYYEQRMERIDCKRVVIKASVWGKFKNVIRMRIGVELKELLRKMWRLVFKLAMD